MSLKTTSKGLLAALTTLSIIAVQAGVVSGGVARAATVAGPHVASPARQHAAVKTAIRVQTQTVSTTTPVSFTAAIPITGSPTVFTNVPGSSATLTPQLATAPAGSPITVTGTISNQVAPTSTLPITVNLTLSSGAVVLLGATTTVTRTGAFTVVASLPLTTTYGTSTISVLSRNAFGLGDTETATLPSFTLNQPAISYAPTLGANLRCVTATVAFTDFAPGIAITPTLVYSSTSSVTKTVPLSLTTSTGVVSPTTPISNGTVSNGNISGTITLPTDLAYGTTGALSVTSTYPFTPTAFPTFTVSTPSVSASGVDAGVTGFGVTPGPLGINLVVGQGNTLNANGVGFVPNSPITVTFGLSGTAPAVLTGAGAIRSDVTGAFTATSTFTPSVVGTYVLTATDLTGCNVATTAVQVISGPVPSAPVSTIYFPEGYTGSGSVNGKASYVETLSLLNPNVSQVVVTDTYLIETGNTDITATATAPDVVNVTRIVPPLADVVVNVQTDIASAPVASGPDAGKTLTGFNAKVATRVQTAGFLSIGAAGGLGGIVRGVAAERTIERVNNSGQRLDGDVSLGTTSPSMSYYFAEGYTGNGFQEYLALLNPSSTTPTTVTVLGAPEGGASTSGPLVSGLVLAPLQRVTLNVNRLNANMVTSGTSVQNKLGLIVNSDTSPIVVERIEYFGPGNGSSKSGESLATGTTTGAKQLNFAYGSLTANTPDVLSAITPTADLAQTADDRAFITVMNPNVAGQIVAGTLSGSASAPGPAAHVTVQLRGENGRLLGFFFTDVDAGSRFTLSYNDLTSSASGIGFPGVPVAAPVRAGVFSAVVSSSERVVSEIAQYYGQGSVTPSGDAGAGAPGLALIGAPTGETDVFFPALTTTDPTSTQPLSQSVFLYNPGVTTIRINGTFFGPAGVLAHYAYQIGPDQIQVISQVGSSHGGVSDTTNMSIPAGTTGAEFTTIQQRGATQSGEPAQAPEAFVAAAVTHSADASNWWGTQGYYPLPVDASCSTSTGQPQGAGCP